MTTFGILSTVLSEIVTRASCIHLCEATYRKGVKSRADWCLLADSLMWEVMTDILEGAEE